MKVLTDKQSKNIAVKSNLLIDSAQMNYSLGELRIIFYLVQAINRKDREEGQFQKDYKLSVAEYTKLLGTAYQGEWRRAAQMLNNLLKNIYN